MAYKKLIKVFEDFNQHKILKIDLYKKAFVIIKNEKGKIPFFEKIFAYALLGNLYFILKFCYNTNPNDLK